MRGWTDERRRKRHWRKNKQMWPLESDRGVCESNEKTETRGAPRRRNLQTNLLSFTWKRLALTFVARVTSRTDGFKGLETSPWLFSAYNTIFFSVFASVYKNIIKGRGNKSQNPLSSLSCSCSVQKRSCPYMLRGSDCLGFTFFFWLPHFSPAPLLSVFLFLQAKEMQTFWSLQAEKVKFTTSGRNRPE